MKKKHKYFSKRTVMNIKTSSELDLNEVIELLKIPTQKRTKYDIRSIQNYMLKNIQYF